MASIRLILSLSLLSGLSTTAASSAQESSLEPIARWKGFPDWVTSVAFSPDGKWLAAGSYDVVRLWDCEAKKEVGELKTRCGFAQALAFPPDSRTLIVGGFGQVQWWNVTERKQDAAIKVKGGYAHGLALSPDHRRLATGSDDAKIQVWDVDARKVVQTIGPLEYPVLGLAWSLDGKQLASAEGAETRLTQPGPVKLWNAASGELTRTLTPHEKAATDVVFTGDGKWLLSTSLDEHVNVYDAATGEAHGFFGGHSRPTNKVVSIPGGPAISAGGGRFKGKNEIKVFDPASGDEFGSIDFHEGKVSAIALAPDGRTLASGSYDKTVALWDITPLLPEQAETTLAVADTKEQPAEQEQTMRIGIIGLDTSHCIAFTKLFNAEPEVETLRGMRVVAAYPKGSPDIESSVSRVPKYTEDIQKLGVKIVPSIDELVAQVDAVLLETNDGRPRLEQVLPVLKAHKPVFVDKPVAASLTDVIAIFEAARHYGTPMFSSSSLRWIAGAEEATSGKGGKVLGCDTFGPCTLEATHPDLFWYGIHGVEALFRVMGPGCKSVSRAATDDFDLVTGVWEDGRIGTFRGLRAGERGYGGTVFLEKKNVQLGTTQGYAPLLDRIAVFFRTGQAPVAERDTLEIYAFMQAADESKRQGGAPVDLARLREQARGDAVVKLKSLIPDYQP